MKNKNFWRNRIKEIENKLKKNIKQFRISNKNFHIVYNDKISKRIDKLRIRYRDLLEGS